MCVSQVSRRSIAWTASRSYRLAKSSWSDHAFQNGSPAGSSWASIAAYFTLKFFGVLEQRPVWNLDPFGPPPQVRWRTPVSSVLTSVVPEPASDPADRGVSGILCEPMKYDMPTFNTSGSIERARELSPRRTHRAG